MGVRVEVNGRRSVTVEVEAEGSAEEVWRAIATGPGISSWFVPAEIDSDAVGQPTRMVCNFGPGMDSVATVTEWNAPRSFAVESRDFVVGGPPVATVWSVEEGAGGTCVVRVEHSLFTDGDEYDGSLVGVEAGWPAFFRILQIYMADFRGQPCALLDLPGVASRESPAWDTLAAGLGIAAAKSGQSRSAPADAPQFAGLVDRVPDEAEVIIRLDEPTSGVAHLFAMPADDLFIMSVRLYLYGEDAAEVVARDKPGWKAWMQERFPFPPG